MLNISRAYIGLIGIYFAYIIYMSMYWKKIDKFLMSIVVIISFILTNVLSLDMHFKSVNKFELNFVSYAHASQQNYLPFALRPYSGKSKTITREMLSVSQKASKQTIGAVHKVISEAEKRVDFEDLKYADAIRPVNNSGAKSSKHIAKKSNNVYSTRTNRSTNGVTNNLSANIGGARKGIGISRGGRRENRKLIISNKNNINDWSKTTQKRQNYDYMNNFYNKMDHVGAEEYEKDSVSSVTDSINTGMEQALSDAQNNYDMAQKSANSSDSSFHYSIIAMTAGIGLIIKGQSMPKGGWPLIVAGIISIGSGFKMMHDGQKMGAGQGNIAGDYSNIANLILEEGVGSSQNNADYVNERLFERTQAAINYSRTSFSNYGRGDPRNKISTMRDKTNVNSNYYALQPHISGINSSRRGRSTKITSSSYSRD